MSWENLNFFQRKTMEQNVTKWEKKRETDI